MLKGAQTIFAVFCFAILSSEVHAAELHVDPQNGDMSGDGSAQSPWSTLEAVVAAGLLKTGAAVSDGDTLLLHSGYHGAVVVRGEDSLADMTIAAATGEEPALWKLEIRDVTGWTFSGLTLSPQNAPQYEVDNIVYVASGSDITIEQCRLFSVADATGWSQSDWDTLSCNGFRVDADKVTLRHNRLNNVNFGISVSGNDCLIERNTVDGFAGDGIRGLGDRGVFQYNVVKNCYDVNENHDDGFQSWSLGADGSVGTGEVVGVVLRGNTIINYEDPDQPFRCTLQGIGCFDGMFVDWVVENNVIITDHWHGITLSGARNCRIVNNTVIDLNDQDPGPPWVRIGNHKDGTLSTGCLIRNNLTADVSIDEGAGVTEDHNLIVEDGQAHFVDQAGNDLHLLDT